VPGAGRDDGQRGDVQAELARLGHLADAGAQAEEGIAADARGEVGDGELDVVDLYSGESCVSGLWRDGGEGLGTVGERTRAWFRRNT
jgi:hypothetical protein